MLFLNLLITQKHTEEKPQNHGFGVYVFPLLNFSYKRIFIEEGISNKE